MHSRLRPRRRRKLGPRRNHKLRRKLRLALKLKRTLRLRLKRKPKTELGPNHHLVSIVPAHPQTGTVKSRSSHTALIRTIRTRRNASVTSVIEPRPAVILVEIARRSAMSVSQHAITASEAGSLVVATDPNRLVGTRHPTPEQGLPLCYNQSRHTSRRMVPLATTRAQWMSEGSPIPTGVDYLQTLDTHLHHRMSIPDTSITTATAGLSPQYGHQQSLHRICLHGYLRSSRRYHQYIPTHPDTRHRLLLIHGLQTTLL